MAINQTHLVWSPKMQSHLLGWSVCSVHPQGGEGQGTRGDVSGLLFFYFSILPSDVRILRQWKAENQSNAKRWPVGRSERHFADTRWTGAMGGWRRANHRTDCKVQDFSHPLDLSHHQPLARHTSRISLWIGCCCSRWGFLLASKVA